MMAPKRATPSMNAAVKIIAPRMSPAASGWRAILSVAALPIIPMPIPAPLLRFRSNTSQ